MSAKATPPPVLVLGVDGAAIGPTSFDVVHTLAFVQAFISLMEAIAAAEDKDLGFTGLDVRKGSAAFDFRTSHPSFVRTAARKAQFYVVGSQEPERGLWERVATVRAALERLPETHDPYLERGKTRIRLPKEFAAPEAYRETTTIRARVVSAGGSKPRVRLASPTEGTISARAHQDLAQRAAKSLYREIDAVVTIEWAKSGRVEDAELLDFDPVEDLEPDEEIARWRRWFERAGAEWEDVDDVELELGRRLDS